MNRVSLNTRCKHKNNSNSCKADMGLEQILLDLCDVKKTVLIYYPTVDCAAQYLLENFIWIN